MQHNIIHLHTRGIGVMRAGLWVATRVLAVGVWLANASMRRLRCRVGNGRWQGFPTLPRVEVRLCDPES